MDVDVGEHGDEMIESVDVVGVVKRHKGRSPLTIRACVCGRQAIRCAARSHGQNRLCRNRPRLCGFCAAHCTGHAPRKKKAKVED